MATIEGAPAHGTVAHLLPQTYKRMVAEWLEEDTPSFDYGGFVVGDDMAEAKLLGKSEVRYLFFSPSHDSSLVFCHFETRYFLLYLLAIFLVIAISAQPVGISLSHPSPSPRRLYNVRLSITALPQAAILKFHKSKHQERPSITIIFCPRYFTFSTEVCSIYFKLVQQSFRLVIISCLCSRALCLTTSHLPFLSFSLPVFSLHSIQKQPSMILL